MVRYVRWALLGAFVLAAMSAPVAHADEGLATMAAPTASFSLTSPSPTNTGTLTFGLTFSEPITGLEVADLSLGGTATGCAIADPTGSAASWSVTVGGCGDGTVTLTLAANSVVNAADEPGPPEPVTSPSGTIDLVVPAVTKFAATTPQPITGTTINYELTFSEPVTGLTATDFTFAGTSTGWSVTNVTGSDAAYVVSISNAAPVSGTVVLRLVRDSVIDLAGNTGPPARVDAPSVTVQPPAAPSATLVINGGASSTADPTLSLKMTASNFGSGLEMRFSIDGGKSWTSWRSFAASHSLALPAKHRWGTLTVTGAFRDSAGKSAGASSSINYVQAPRSTMALRPRYLLSTKLDYANARLTVRQVVDLTNNSKAVIGYLDFSVLARHFGELVINSVAVDGHAAGTSFTNTANARVALGFNLRPSESAQVVINFTAVAKSGTGNFLKAAFAKANGLMQMSNWHPLLSNGHGLRHPGDSQYSASADYRLELTHPKNVRIVAPGKLVSSTATTKVYTLPNAREFAFAASPGFLTSSATTNNGVKVSVHYLSGTKGVANALKTSVRGIQRMSANLGAYPYAQFHVVQGTRPYSATEFSGLVFVGSANFGSTYVVAHEIAHQWWYGIVGNDQMAEPWLDEAFAEWSSRYFFSMGMPSYCSSRPVNSSIHDFPNKPTASGCSTYTQTVYHKGAAFLNGIRNRLGTNNFLAALRAIVKENRFGIVTTETVRSTFLRFASDKKALNNYMNGFLR